MRAFLATSNYSLGAMWFNAMPLGYPTDGIPLSFESLAVGDTVGAGFVRSLNESQTHTNAHNSFIAWLGDPTLRFQILAPPSNLTMQQGKTIQFKWQPSPEPRVQYWVYRSAASRNGSWSRLTAKPLIQTTFTDLNPLAGPALYQVRALKLTETGSGSFTNLSQGVFIAVP